MLQLLKTNWARLNPNKKTNNSDASITSDGYGEMKILPLETISEETPDPKTAFVLQRVVSELTSIKRCECDEAKREENTRMFREAHKAAKLSGERYRCNVWGLPCQ